MSELFNDKMDYIKEKLLLCLLISLRVDFFKILFC